MKIYFTILLALCSINSFSQNKTDSISLIPTDTTTKKLAKVEHAEPLYIDLMRDLGAKKGEAEVNIGMEINIHNKYDEYYGFLEYEWAIANRLGLEVEVPFSFNHKSKGNDQNIILPGNKIEGVKLASQYTFLVNEKKKLSMAIAYVHEFELSTFKEIANRDQIFTGMKMTPVFIAAKNFSNINTMLYTGPVFEHNYHQNSINTGATINASVMFVIPHTKNFIGLENNIDFDKNNFNYYLHPQIKLAIKHNLMIGLVTGIPIANRNSRGDVMTRLIWEL